MSEDRNEIEKLKLTVKTLAETVKTSVSQQLALANTATGDILDSRIKSVLAEIAAIEKSVSKLGERHDHTENIDKQQSNEIDELLATNRQIKATLDIYSTKIATHTQRLDGTVEYGGTDAVPIEHLRVVVSRISDQLSGSGDQLAYSEVRSSIANTKLLGSFMKWFIGLFGTGSLIGVVGLVTGFGKPLDFSVPLAEQRTKIEVLTAQNKVLTDSIDKLELRLNRLTEKNIQIAK